MSRKPASLIFAVIPFFIALPAISETAMEKDGVPNIDVRGRAVVVMIPKLTPLGQPPATEEVEKRVVTVAGKDMSLVQFYRTYCSANHARNPTCIRAAKVSDLDGLGRINGKLRPLPAGL